MCVCVSVSFRQSCVQSELDKSRRSKKRKTKCSKTEDEEETGGGEEDSEDDELWKTMECVSEETELKPKSESYCCESSWNYLYFANTSLYCGHAMNSIECLQIEQVNLPYIVQCTQLRCVLL